MNMDIKQLVGDNMRAARKLKKLTQQKVADHWGMKQTQYSRYEIGRAACRERVSING